MHPLVSHYRRGLEPVVRGPLGIAVTVGVFLAAAGIGDTPGVVMASLWVLVSGTYCLANFACCRETHCVFTGSGWTAIGLAALTAVSISGTGVGLLRVEAVTIAYLVVLGVGYGVEGLVAARTGPHVLVSGDNRAEDR